MAMVERLAEMQKAHEKAMEQTRSRRPSGRGDGRSVSLTSFAEQMRREGKVKPFPVKAKIDGD